jgi:hypothetical protein
VRSLGVCRVFDVFGSAQFVTLIRVDHERYPLTDRRNKLSYLAKRRNRVPVTVKGEDGTMGSYTGAEH